MATSISRGNTIVATVAGGGAWATTTNAYDGTAGGPLLNTYATWTSAVASDVGSITIGGYRFGSNGTGLNFPVGDRAKSIRNGYAWPGCIRESRRVIRVTNRRASSLENEGPWAHPRTRISRRTMARRPEGGVPAGSTGSRGSSRLSWPRS